MPKIPSVREHTNCDAAAVMELDRPRDDLAGGAGNLDGRGADAELDSAGHKRFTIDTHGEGEHSHA